MNRIDTAERDTVARNWGKKNLSALKTEAKSLGIRTYTGAFYRYLGTRFFKNRNGVIGAIGFKMPRHAVFVHKGVGRGYPIEAAQSGRDLFSKPGARSLQATMVAKGYNKTTIKMALRRTGHGNSLQGKQRRPKPWFNPVIDRNLPKLADDLAKANADLISKNILIK